MPTFVRWIITIIIILLGLVAAVYVLALLQFGTWSCYGDVKDTALVILRIAAGVTALALIPGAVQLIRKATPRVVWLTLGLGFLLIILFNGVFMFYTGRFC